MYTIYVMCPVTGIIATYDRVENERDAHFALREATDMGYENVWSQKDD